VALNLVLVPQRQSSKGMALAWGAVEGVQAYEVFVAQKRLSPEELEAAEASGGSEECLFASLAPGVTAVVDDVTPAGEPRFYAVAMRFADGTLKPARFRALPDGAPPAALALSSAKGASRPLPQARKPTAAPGAPPPAPEDPFEARKRAQREARAHAMGEALTEPPGPAEVFGRGEPFIRVAPARETPRAAATPPPAGATPPPPAATTAAPARAAPAAEPSSRPRAAATPPAAEDAPAPPSNVPLEEENLDLRLTGADQTWDGLRICWERDARAAAFEVIVSDHRISGDELKEALAGRADFTTAAAFPASATAVIDNVTAREARGWYAVLLRTRDGKRLPHAFQVGDAAATGKAAAPFLNPNRTGEVRAEAEGMVEEAREHWQRWKAERDGGARAEAKRLVRDALLVFPGLPSAAALAAEMG